MTNATRCIWMLPDGSRCHRHAQKGDNICDRCDERLTEILHNAKLQKLIKEAAAKIKNGDTLASSPTSKPS
jgi:hypothetical protein